MNGEAPEACSVFERILLSNSPEVCDRSGRHPKATFKNSYLRKLEVSLLVLPSRHCTVLHFHLNSHTFHTRTVQVHHYQFQNHVPGCNRSLCQTKIWLPRSPPSDYKALPFLASPSLQQHHHYYHLPNINATPRLLSRLLFLHWFFPHCLPILTTYPILCAGQLPIGQRRAPVHRTR